MSQLKDLREKRAVIHAQVVELLKTPQGVEARTKVDTMLADIENIGGDIARIERAEKIAAELEGRATTQPNVETRDNKVAAAEYRSAFFDYLQHGAPGFKSRGCSPESHLRISTISKQMAAADKPEQRDQIAGTQSITYTEGTTGGYFVPAGFVYDVEKATKYFAPLLDSTVLRVIKTASGNVLPFPTSNDTNQAWQTLGEAQQVLENNGSPSYRANYNTTGSAPSGVPGDVLMGSIPLGAYKGTTGIIRVSLELLQDSAFSLEAFLTEAFAVRLGRGYEYYLTQGTGSNQPTGILPAIAASGATPITAVGQSNYGAITGQTATNSISYQDLINLIHSVDPTYRKGAKFMLHDATVANLKKQIDAFGRPLWVPAVKDGEPDTLCGYPFVVNQSFPQIAASATTVAFGQWSKFIVRQAADLQTVRLDERFADFGEVGFVGFSRIDSNLIDAGTHPLNVLVQHS